MIYLQCKFYTINIYTIVSNNTNKKLKDAKLFILKHIISVRLLLKWHNRYLVCEVGLQNKS